MKSTIENVVSSQARHTNHTESMPFGYGPRIKALVNLSIAHIELTLPGEFNLKTGQLLKQLVDHSDGITKVELAKTLNPHFSQSSANRQNSILSQTEKLIQRSRKKYYKFGIGIHCCRRSGKFIAIPLALGEFFLN